jgi:hypothetical protein
MSGKHIPMKILELRNPERAARIRAYDRSRPRRGNPDREREYKKHFKETNRAKYIMQCVRNEARQKGVCFEISEAWVQERLDTGKCELSGLPFCFNETRDLPSIDRRIPGGDYVESNCRLILFGLNSLLRHCGDAQAVARIRELRTGA